jgi:hypothetical protein
MLKANSFVIAAVLGLTATAASANDTPKHSFTRDGQTHVYTATFKDGRTILDGRSYPSGSAFRLIVRGAKVRGTVGGQPVAFTHERAPGAAPIAVASAN